MTEPQTTWTRYTQTWSAPAADRRALFEASLQPDCVYTDPLTQTRGWSELEDYIDAFQAQFPGGHFTVDSFVSHHDQCLVQWTLRGADGSAVQSGTSHGAFRDGKLAAMTGFYATP